MSDSQYDPNSESATVTGSVTVTNFPATQPVSGTVAVSNFPATQNVAVTSSVEVEVKNDTGNPIPVSGTFFQATQPVSGTVAATQSGTWTVQPGNTANTTAWKVDGSAVTQPVSGTFFQATQPVSGTFFQATQPVSASSLPLPTGAATAANQATEIANLQALNSLVPSTYDYISLAYTGTDLTSVVFKTGGSGGSTVSTLTLAYASSILQSVTRT